MTKITFQLPRLEVVELKNKIMIRIGYSGWTKSPSVVVIRPNMRVTRQIVLPLLTNALYTFGCFEGIFQKSQSCTNANLLS